MRGPLTHTRDEVKLSFVCGLIVGSGTLTLVILTARLASMWFR